MNNFELQLLTEWRKLGLPFSGETFVVAVSGGADSISLVLALNGLKRLGKLDLRLVIAHFNHNLRGEESRKDEEFIRSFAVSRRLELAVGQGDIPKEGNLEQNARSERYRFLGETAVRLNARGVITGHTINDQAETFLLNLIRGSGTRGLSGMAPVREFGQIRQFDTTPQDHRYQFPSELLLVRPLLSWAKRRETESYCREAGTEFRYDTMNEDLSFQRVRVRKVLLPVLRDFNPKIIETLARTADLLRLEFEGQPGSADNGRAEPDWTGEDILLADVASLPKSIVYRGLRIWLEGRRGDLRGVELKHIEAIERLINSRKSGKYVEIPDKCRVVKSGGRITFEK